MLDRWRDLRRVADLRCAKKLASTETVGLSGSGREEGVTKEGVDDGVAGH